MPLLIMCGMWHVACRAHQRVMRRSDRVDSRGSETREPSRDAQVTESDEERATRVEINLERWRQGQD